jgi:type IV secretory pathway ATPase VirB11/archaellum biosynthesis ATPase
MESPTAPRIVSEASHRRIRILEASVGKAPLPCAARLAHGAGETRPCFASSWLEQTDHTCDEVCAEYKVGEVSVRLLSREGCSHGFYLIDPPEYRLNPVDMQIMTDVIGELNSTPPRDMDVGSLRTVRHYVKARAKDLIYSKLAAKPEASQGRALELEAEQMAEMLVRYTAGYGIFETLLNDPRIQDIYVDSPSSRTPVHVVLRSDVSVGVRQKCRTNIYLGSRDLTGFVSRVKFETGLPFSEAHPVLEADMGGLGARLTVVGPPLSVGGVSIALRRHSDAIWTMPKLIANGTISPLISSFLWASAIGRRTVLIAGSRGAGKTTLLSAVMLEFPLSQRILLIEDTPEIQGRRMQDLGYDMQSMRFSTESDTGTSTAQDALKVSLRMGESAIVIGEVRGREANVLYESMRAGNAGSSVLGTIHGNSAKGVLYRATEDLGITERAFSSTDLVVVIGLIRTPEGKRFHRRVVEIAEVRPAGDHVDLVSLFEMKPGCSCAKPTDEFNTGCKAIDGIARSLGIAPERVLDMIKTKAHADQVMSEKRTAVPGHAGLEDDRIRVRSNEVLAELLFSNSVPEAGLDMWRDWYETLI